MTVTFTSVHNKHNKHARQRPVNRKINVLTDIYYNIKHSQSSKGKDIPVNTGRVDGNGNRSPVNSGSGNRALPSAHLHVEVKVSP